MADLRTARLTNTDAEFYPTIGPFLARRDVHKVIGCPPWDDPGKVWFVFYRGKEVAGFAAVQVEGAEAVFCSDYAAAGDVIARETLLRERSKWAKKRGIAAATAVVSAEDRTVYVRAGFEVVRETKNFTKMRKELKWASV